MILHPGEALSFNPPRVSVSLACVAGCLHVTQTGDPADHVLQAGDSLQSAQRGKVVVTSFTCSTIEVRTYVSKRLSASPAIAPPTTMIQGRTFQTMSRRNAASASAKSAGFTIALVQTGV